MADNKVLIEVVVTDKGLKLSQKNIDNLTDSVDKSSKKTKEAKGSAEDLFSTQNKGIIGTANSTKSFSKLAQTIGSDGTGLVGAYATLAANAFAVSAAFNALRSAQQAEMVLQGLEAQGARTGSALTVAADKMREIVGFGISSQEAMSATALFTSSGFRTEELERLSEVAKNTSLALGRNLPDSLDRLIKGTTKLEPELLDELGIMTKLGDATSAYALKVGKTANSLSPFERKQAFLNAVLAEGELKFGGIADSIDTNPYDKLAASFINLTTSSLNFVNNSGLKDFVEFLSENTAALSGVILLFASSIQKNLLGSLNDLSTKSSEAAKATKALATQAKENIKTEIDSAKISREAAITQARSISIHEKSAKGIKDRAEALKLGTLSEKEFEKAIKSNQLSIETHSRYRNREASEGIDTAPREKLIKELEAQGVALTRLRNMEVEYAKASSQAQGASISSLRKEYALSRSAKAQDAAASAIQAASNLELGTSLNSLAVATRNYSIAVKIETRDKLASSTATGTLLVAQTAMARGMGALQIASFAASTGIKALGGAVLRLIPYIGLAMLAMDALTSAWDWIASKIWPEGTKAQKELTKASEEFTKVLETQSDALAYYAKIQDSSASASSRATTATMNQATSLIELAESFKQLTQARKLKAEADRKDAESNSQNAGGLPFAERRLVSEPKKSKGFDYGITESSIEFELGSKVIQESLDRLGSSFREPTEDSTQLVGQLKILAARLGRDGLSKAIIESVGSFEKWKALSVDDQYEALSRVSEKVAAKQSKIKEAVEGLNGAFTSGEAAASKFFKDAIGSTPFDDIVVSFEQINSNIRTLAREGKTATEQLQLISGIGSELQKFLSPKDSSLLDTLKEADSIYQSLVGREKDLVGVEKIRFDQAKATLSNSEGNLQKLSAALELAESENRLRQASVALAKAQASVIQAQQSKYAEFLSMTAAGQKAQVLAQREINSLNVAAQKAQKAVLENMIAQEESKLRAIEHELHELEAKQETLALDEQKTLEYAKQYEIMLKMAQGVSGPLMGSGGYIQNNTDENQYLKDAQANMNSSAERAKELQERAKAIGNSMRASKLQVEALRLAIEAATTSSLTNAQIAAKNASDKIADEEKRAALLRQTAAEERKTLDLDNKLVATKSGLLDGVDYKVRVLGNSQMDIVDSWKEINSQIAINNGEIERAKSILVGASGADAAGLRAAIDLLENTNQQLDIQVKSKIAQQDLTQKIALAEIFGLNTLEEKSAAQREILDLAQKELDIYQELQSIKYANDNEKRDTLSSITGVTLNNEVRDAANALRIAKETSELRIQTINLEYDLLERQRQQRQDEYTKKAELAYQTGDLDKAVELTGLAEQTKAGQNLIADARASAVGAITANTEQKELALSKARIMEHTNVLLENFKKLGPDGEAAATIFSGMTTITFAVTDAFKAIGAEGATTADKIGAIAGAASAAIGAVASMLSSISNAKIASIDKEIAAEDKRDGKSAQSVAKLEALEKKKDTIARKAFNTNKKLMMAQAVMSTAAGVAGALASSGTIGPVAAAIMAGVIGAMGVAQIAIISGTQYESSAAAKSVATPSSISIGKRSDTVDLAKGPNANAGGEAGYLRGSQGSGSNASNYNTVGSAYGGKDLMRGYGNRGFIVGEKGPERINPETPISVTPANDVGTQQPLNATFNIQALDSSGVQELLVAQKGNIIKMLRDAANASGKSFMEDVNTNVYLRPSVGKL